MTLYDYPFRISFIGAGTRTSWARSEMVSARGAEGAYRRGRIVIEMCAARLEIHGCDVLEAATPAAATGGERR